MPNLNHNGPSNQGPKTGKKLGKCRKTELEKKEIEEICVYNKSMPRKSNESNEKDSCTNNRK